jgi:hypothetical protein
VLDNRVLRRIFGSKRNEVRRYWRETLCDELHVLYSSPDFIRVIKLR